MLPLRIILVIFLCTLIQSLVPVYLKVFNYVDLALVLTVYLGLQRKEYQAMFSGAAAGFSQDLFLSSKLLGANGFTKTLIGYVLAVLSSRFRLDNPFLRIFVLTVSSAVSSALFVFLHYFFAVVPNGMDVKSSVNFGLRQLLGNFLAALVLFPLFDKLFREAPYDPSRPSEVPRRRF